MAKHMLVAMVSALLVCACAGRGPLHAANQDNAATRAEPAAHADAARCDAAGLPQSDMQLQMINDLIAHGTLHAALAHLDALDATSRETPAAQYLRADILRRTDRAAEAATIYRGLLTSCLAGEGYHGLGLTAAKAGDLPAALTNLQAARRYLPTDPKVRNDYGYALLLDRQYALAQSEFMTAMELGGDDGRAALNYLTLLFIEGRKQEAQEFADRKHISRDDVLALQQQAQQLTDSAQSPATAGKSRAVKASGVQP